jgi:hypothetical protein
MNMKTLVTRFSATHNPIAVRALLLLIPLSLSTTHLAEADPAGTLIHPRVNHTATRLLDGRVLLTGGTIAGFMQTDSCEIYDPATNTWTATGNLSLPRTIHQAVLLADGGVLVAGGLSSTTLTKTVEIYDPATETWTFTKSLLNYNPGTLVVLADGRVLAPGGQQQSAATCELYDPNTGRWSLTGNLNIPRKGCNAIRLSDGRVLAMGGVEPMMPGYVRQWELYDPASGTWSLTGTFNQTHSYFEPVLLSDGRVLVAGDRVGKNYPSRITEIYDPTTGIWTVGRLLSTQRAHFTANPLNDGTVLAAGGSSDGPGNDVLDSLETLDAATGRWHLLPTTLATPRQYHTATTLLDGRVLLAGGSSFQLLQLIPDAEVFAISQ